MQQAAKTPVESPSGQGGFRPFVASTAKVPEFTIKAGIIGALFALLFGAVTVYLGLRIGLTVNASIPIAVLSIMILKTLGRSTILENNIVQVIGSAGEAVAAGVIFTIPAVIFLGYNMEYWKITVFALCGGWLGALFMIPLRRALIVKEHGVLPYPEGAACADILIAGEKKGVMAKRVFQGVGFAMLYKFLMSITHFWKEEISWTSKKVAPGMTAAAEISPELIGIGYIIGPRSASIMVAGGVLAWMCLIPLIKFFGSFTTQVILPGKLPIAEMVPGQIWSSYVRYIGAGAVVVGGFYNLIHALPMIIESFKGGMKSFAAGRGSGAAVEQSRTDIDMPNSLVLAGSVTLIAILWMVLNFGIHPGHPGSNFVAAILMVIFGFFFVTVSCRIVGMIGTTSNPVSGDTIATLMFTCILFLVAGWTGGAYALVALSVGAVICIAAANAGTTSQDLKTGYLVGGTPKLQQYGIMLGVTTSAFIIGGTLMFMNRTYRSFTPLESALTIPSDYVTATKITYPKDRMTYSQAIVPDGVTDVPAGRYLVTDGGTSMVSYQEGIGGQKMPAPQARLMSLVVDGILTQKLPWGFLLAGAVIALTMILCGVTSVLAFAVGLYLPISSTAPIFVGGMVRALVDKSRAKSARQKGERMTEEGDTGGGSLFSSGLVAGGSLAGILVAFVAFLLEEGSPGIQSMMAGLTKLGPRVLGEGVAGGEILACLMFGLMGYLMFRIGSKKVEQA